MADLREADVTLWQQLSGAAEAVPQWAWVLVLLSILLPIPMAYLPHIRQAFYQWRSDRRLARDPEIYQYELDDYEYKIGEELDEVEWRDILWQGIANALIVSAAFIVQEAGGSWSVLLPLVFGGVVAAVGLQQWFREAEDSEVDWRERFAEQFPPEAIWGAVGAFVIAVLILTIAVYFF
ncbi:hypothetical protein [Pontixanthobacter aquaemixtae]|uniref:Uncharacterized protein n=1 Tax=Pontixanthobacter aquaemixtae TaxID=1958940 RepID=A0A844ZWQ5_9SPHN|nr:hypothetical protein [Pontixanthobacter aquaemixtae]MXO91672.1 hypothetical protein [Pontixanthobacter aquaemixtae]